ncbi:hypothetical protein FB451DRAFT_1394008 [Mycena latifolia]|nr:hypothetical protein FB451DRAFT_1394008 [Mycena latifolia]
MTDSGTATFKYNCREQVFVALISEGPDAFVAQHKFPPLTRTTDAGHDFDAFSFVVGLSNSATSISATISFLNERPFVPASYATSFVNAARDLASRLSASPSDELHHFESTTGNTGGISELFTESLGKWGTLSYRSRESSIPSRPLPASSARCQCVSRRGTTSPWGASRPSRPSPLLLLRPWQTDRSRAHDNYDHAAKPSSTVPAAPVPTVPSVHPTIPLLKRGHTTVVRPSARPHFKAHGRAHSPKAAAAPKLCAAKDQQQNPMLPARGLWLLSGQSAPDVASPIATTVDGLTRFECPAPDCTHTLDSLGGIRRHYKAKHLGLRRACPLCGVGFQNARNDVVKRHLKNTCKAPQEQRARCIAELPAKKRRIRA